MAVNARTEKFQHLEVFDKPALFTNGRIARDTVPQGWYCYDIRGSDDDPGELCYMEENVVVNHAGSVLMPEKLAMPNLRELQYAGLVEIQKQGCGKPNRIFPKSYEAVPNTDFKKSRSGTPED